MSLAANIQRVLLRRLVSLPEPALRVLTGPRVVSADGYVLEVDAQLLLRAAEVVGHKESAELGVAGARDEMERSLPIVDFHGIRARVSDRTIPGPRGPIPLRIFEPRSARAPRPVLVYFHGGGFVVGSLRSYDGVCRKLARDADAIVVSVDYRLAPEHKFPAGLEDGVAAARWVLANTASLGGNPRAVALGGDSAGGNLTAAVAQALRGDAAQPIFQLLVYPAVDLTCSMPSHRLFREGYMLTEKSIAWYLANYLNDAREKLDPRASPLFAIDLAGLPPALVLTAGFDPLRDEGMAYAEKLQAAGVEARHHCVAGSVHGFFSFGGVFPHARRAVDEAVYALRAAFARAQ
jgi:acetyl esterase